MWGHQISCRDNDCWTYLGINLGNDGSVDLLESEQKKLAGTTIEDTYGEKEKKKRKRNLPLTANPSSFID